MGSRDWCFTCFDVDETTAEDIVKSIYERDIVKYVVAQLERSTEGNLHLQGYLEISKVARYSALKKDELSGAHFEKRLGLQQQAIDYCKKEDTRVLGPWEFGKKSDKKDRVVPRGVRVASTVLAWSDILSEDELSLYTEYIELLGEIKSRDEDTMRAMCSMTKAEDVLLRNWRIIRNAKIEEHGWSMYERASGPFFFLFWEGINSVANHEDWALV